MDVFNSKPGLVAVFTDDTVLPGRIQLSSPSLSSPSVLISGVNYKQEVNRQFQQSLDRDIYLYVFGDLMGGVTVKGVAFPDECVSGDDGVRIILGYYADNRASNRDTPVVVQFGDEAISGFLTQMSLNSPDNPTDPSSFMYPWEMIINALPKTGGGS
jgi:hypothetical protein